MDIDPEKREGLLETAALGGEETVAGLTLRPMTATSYSLLQRILRVAGVTEEQDITFYTFAFAYIHSKPNDKIRTYFSKPEALIQEILMFMETKSPADFMLFNGFCRNQREQVGASMTRYLEIQSSDQDSGPKV